MIPLTYRIRIWRWFWTTFFPWRVKTEEAIYDQNARFRSLQDSLIEQIGTRPQTNEKRIEVAEARIEALEAVLYGKGGKS